MNIGRWVGGVESVRCPLWDKSFLMSLPPLRTHGHWPRCTQRQWKWTQWPWQWQMAIGNPDTMTNMKLLPDCNCCLCPVWFLMIFTTILDIGNDRRVLFHFSHSVMQLLWITTLVSIQLKATHTTHMQLMLLNTTRTTRTTSRLSYVRAYPMQFPW